MRSLLDIFMCAVSACPIPQGCVERDRWVANEMIRLEDVDRRLAKNREKLHQLQERYKAELGFMPAEMVTEEMANRLGFKRCEDGDHFMVRHIKTTEGSEALPGEYVVEIDVCARRRPHLLDRLHQRKEQ